MGFNFKRLPWGKFARSAVDYGVPIADGYFPGVEKAVKAVENIWFKETGATKAQKVGKTADELLAVATDLTETEVALPALQQAKQSYIDALVAMENAKARVEAAKEETLEAIAAVRAARGTAAPPAAPKPILTLADPPLQFPPLSSAADGTGHP